MSLYLLQPAVLTCAGPLLVAEIVREPGDRPTVVVLSLRQAQRAASGLLRLVTEVQ